jgi:hypothetical protein
MTVTSKAATSLSWFRKHVMSCQRYRRTRCRWRRPSRKVAECDSLGPCSLMPPVRLSTARPLHCRNFGARSSDPSLMHLFIAPPKLRDCWLDSYACRFSPTLFEVLGKRDVRLSSRPVSSPGEPTTWFISPEVLRTICAPAAAPKPTTSV